MDKNKLKFVSGIICRSSAVDQTTQSLSAFNVIDEITVDLEVQNPSDKNSVGKIAVPISFQVISVWKRNTLSDLDKDTKTSLEVDFIDPIGEKLNTSKIEILIPKNKRRCRYILTVNGIPVTTTGEYEIRFRESDKTTVLGSMHVDIVVNKK